MRSLSPTLYPPFMIRDVSEEIATIPNSLAAALTPYLKDHPGFIHLPATPYLR